MDLRHYREVFAACSLTLIMVAAAPAIGLILPLPSGGEKFSEFWILGPNHMTEDYPFNVHVNESFSAFVGVGNHMGISSYYLIYVKFRNQTQPLPNTTSSEPSSLTPLYESRAFVADGHGCEVPLAFRILSASRNDDSALIGRVSINDDVFVINASSEWDSEFKGFYYQLFFELWRYDVTGESFRFHSRFVGIWLNVTVSVPAPI